MPELTQNDRQHLQQDEERNKVQVGMRSDGTPVYMRVNAGGYLLSKLIGYDVDGSGEDIQIAVDPEGRLKIQLDSVSFEGDVNIDTNDLESYVLDQRLQFLFSGSIADGDNTYVGYEDKNGLWYIVLYDVNGNPSYAKGSGGIPNRLVPANWTALSYGPVFTTF